MPLIPTSFEGEAYNPVPDSRNQIHADDVARQFGFEGALVPGVTISAYLAQPAVVAWGEPWLESGHAHIVVKKPLYDRRRFRVEVTPHGTSAYDGELVDETGTLVASGRFELKAHAGPPPKRRGDALPGSGSAPPTREGLEALKLRGMTPLRMTWGPAEPMVTYFRDPSRMPDLIRWDRGGYANTSFVLGLTNWIFAANVELGPWVHLETESAHFAPIPRGAEVIAEAAIVGLFEKKGHAFVDVDVTAFRTDDSPVLAARLRAIYRLRGG